MCKLSRFLRGNKAGDMPSPRYDILWKGIIYDHAKGILSVSIGNDAQVNTVQNTNSMEPLIDVGHRIITSSSPRYLNHLHVGDIIIWERAGRSTIHSIVETGSDEFGTYYRTQGLNIPRLDPERIRKVEIKAVCLGVIWTRGEGAYEAREGD